MTVRELYLKLNTMYPKELSLSWDNDGLMVCADQDREVRRVLVALDATLAAINYAKDNGFDTLITHHPMLFRGVKYGGWVKTSPDAVSAMIRENLEYLAGPRFDFVRERSEFAEIVKIQSER